MLKRSQSKKNQYNFFTNTILFCQLSNASTASLRLPSRLNGTRHLIDEQVGVTQPGFGDAPESSAVGKPIENDYPLREQPHMDLGST